MQRYTLKRTVKFKGKVHVYVKDNHTGKWVDSETLSPDECELDSLIEVCAKQTGEIE